ncbi:hypothetical protein CHGG_01697 [Chaetomium globosum CBS 148.51]|uniref:DUF1479 domain protein n=1 Tax=Chaetomium globosum (strain ATCC 6205 / CBS 148.51 / DSM 1962 / NBRC 6347 / NRRL 1970) TaxID=306901 RepID=Q2HDK7_CHAGB|nr:uncharacterized protein CHGG_01697 [Chaetomium globosum CBS 148.51]EAQ93462.1 hypothetical protein CHGG_01697 [Chaetomium globosum CBS 148.51]
MANTVTWSPDTISDSEFQEVFASYPAFIAEISDAKGAKPGQETLASLDHYRYGTALDAFGSEDPGTAMDLDHVKKLVEWKLRHGKFRPTLMKLVSSNEPGFVRDTVQKAVAHFRDKADVSGALNILTELKGIGPATASLLLAVHDPKHVVFFADEAFYWLCCNGSKAPIKYNQKEYTELNKRAQALTKRLGVKAVDIERVAFVLMRRPKDENTGSASARKPPAGSVAEKQLAKRKASGDNSADAVPPHGNHGPLPILTTMVDPFSRARWGETQSFAYPGPIQLTPRFTTLKEGLTSNKETAVSASWQRLLGRLSEEIDTVSSLGSEAIPTINFKDTNKSEQAKDFLRDLRQRGVGVIRNVIPKDTALAWNREADEYLKQGSPNKPAPKDTESQDVFWSPAQVKARAHPNVLAAQKFAMSVWQSKDKNARVTTSFPISYADRMVLRKGDGLEDGFCARVDGGSVERWEPDGYGRAGTYKDIFQGRWEDYDPWESSTRLGVTSDLYHKAGACSIFRMFQGWLALDSISPGPGSLQVCPIPRLATAYFLLRPFFSPQQDEDQPWTFNRPQNSILHGALPSYAQQITPALHPHLQLDRSMVPVPHLEPGDYLVWHPDLIHAISPHPASPTTTTTHPNPTAHLYLPACPLTQTNALYLARQRKAFLQGHAGPDFDLVGGSGSTAGVGMRAGESGHAGRPGAEAVGAAGGEAGLRAMGLLAWDEEEADEDEEREVLAMANGILFPDLYDML